MSDFNSLGAFGLSGNLGQLVGGGTGILFQDGSLYLLKIIPGSDTQSNRVNIELLWGSGSVVDPTNSASYQQLSNAVAALQTTIAALQLAVDGKQNNLGYQPLNAELNLLDLSNVNSAIDNLGLGSMSLQDIANYFTKLQSDQRYQIKSAELAAIAALTTTSYGRSLLALADAAAGRSALGAAAASDVAALQSSKLDGSAVGSTVQPYDADLAAIAALTTTSYGRSLLTLPDSSAAQTAINGSSVQPYDADLAAIAALTTTSYGRSLLTLADASAAQAAIGVAAGTVGGFVAGTTDFYNRLVANGGSISYGDLIAIDQYLIATSNLPQLCFAPLAGTNLAAARTLLIYPSGGTATLTGMGNPSYSRFTGFTGDGNSYFKSGFNPSTSAYAMSTSASFGLYNRTSAGMDREEMGANVSATSAIFINPKSSNGNAQYSCWSSPGGLANANALGLNLGNRSGSTPSYYSNGTALSTSGSFAGTVPNLELYFGAINYSGAVQYPSQRSIGCFFVGNSLSAAQVTTLTTAINALMTAFGRNVV